MECRISSTSRASTVPIAATSSLPSPAAAPIAAAAKMAAAVVMPISTWFWPRVCRNTRPPPMKPTPVMAPASAFGAPWAAMIPIAPAPAPISAKTRSPVGAPRRSRSKPSA